jgi:hypothetical protein
MSDQCVNGSYSAIEAEIGEVTAGLNPVSL